MVDVGLHQGAAAVRAGIGERCLVGFVDLLGWLAMGLGAVILARFAAGLLGLRLGLTLRKGRGLAFARSPLFVEQPGKLLHLRAKLSNLAFEAKAVQAWCWRHAFTLASRRFFSCASLPGKMADSEGQSPRR
jgi:hypothetical protein